MPALTELGLRSPNRGVEKGNLFSLKDHRGDSDLLVLSASWPFSYFLVSSLLDKCKTNIQLETKEFPFK